MPELPEVEAYRRLAAGAAIGRRIVGVAAGDPWFLKRGAERRQVEALLVGRHFLAARRRGKLLLLDVGVDLGGTAPAEVTAVLGLRFGMTGRLLVDGTAGVDRLLYAPVRDDVRFERFGVTFADGGRLAVSDPRRLGGVEIDPEEERLGPDALTLSGGELAAALAGGQVALKARLMDQSRIAGIGNLLADEILWRASLSPLRPAGSLTPAEVRRLHRHLRGTVTELVERGGSHTGDFMAERRLGGTCPRDGAAVVRAAVGGRTTFWCPRHQVS